MSPLNPRRIRAHQRLWLLRGREGEGDTLHIVNSYVPELRYGGEMCSKAQILFWNPPITLYVSKAMRWHFLWLHPMTSQECLEAPSMFVEPIILHPNKGDTIHTCLHHCGIHFPNSLLVLLQYMYEYQQSHSQSQIFGSFLPNCVSARKGPDNQAERTHGICPAHAAPDSRC